MEIMSNWSGSRSTLPDGVSLDSLDEVFIGGSAGTNTNGAEEEDVSAAQRLMPLRSVLESETSFSCKNSALLNAPLSESTMKRRMMI